MSPNFRIIVFFSKKWRLIDFRETSAVEFVEFFFLMNLLCKSGSVQSLDEVNLPIMQRGNIPTANRGFCIFMVTTLFHDTGVVMQ